VENSISEKTCQERNQRLENKFDEMKNEIKDASNKFLLIWVGNGKVGVKHKIDTMWVSYLNKKKTSQGIMDWAFRLVVITLLGIILKNGSM